MDWLWLFPRKRARIAALRETYRAAKATAQPKTIKSAALDLLREVSTSSDYGREVEEIYRDVLAMLKDHPSLKPFALELGRVAYGSKREDRLPTTYDEQAILNDINVHT